MKQFMKKKFLLGASLATIISLVSPVMASQKFNMGEDYGNDDRKQERRAVVHPLDESVDQIRKMLSEQLSNLSGIAKDREAGLQGEIDELNGANADFEKLLGQAEEEKLKLNNAMENKGEQHHLAMANLQKEYDQTARDFRTLVGKKEEELGNAKDQLAGLNDQIKASTKMYLQAMKAAEAEEAELKQARNSVGELKGQLEEANVALKDANKECEGMQKEISGVYAELEGVQATYNKLQRDSDNTVKDFLEALNAEKAKSARVPELEKELDGAQKIINVLRAEKADLDEREAELLALTAQLRAPLYELPRNKDTGEIDFAVIKDKDALIKRFYEALIAEKKQEQDDADDADEGDNNEPKPQQQQQYQGFVDQQQ